MRSKRYLQVSLAPRSAGLVLLALVIISTLLFRQAQPQPSPAVLLPSIIQVIPAQGEEQALDAPVRLVFDQPMDARSVQAAFSIAPPVAGDLTWPTSNTLQFKPAGAGFERAVKYTISLKKSALSQSGQPLKAPEQFHFATIGFLEVGSVQPAQDATQVATDATITVLFNRPVVPLVAIEDQGNLPQPLTLVPPARGKGEWLNTSIYVFTPEGRLEPATTYKARIAAGLADTTGGVLRDDFTWQFTTVTPAVIATYPTSNTLYVSARPVIHVAFNQAMDRVSAQAAFELRDSATGQIVEGKFEWHAEGLAQPNWQDYADPYQWSWDRGEGPAQVGVETMSFTPGQPLNFDTVYAATLAGSAQAAKGQISAQKPFTWTFKTIQYPRIVETNPADGEQRGDPWGALYVTFSSPMDPKSIGGSLSFSPPVTASHVYSYWYDNNTHFRVYIPGGKPNSQYTVTLGSQIQGRYGDKLDQACTIHWRTRAYDPMVRLYTPGEIGVYSAYTRTMAYVRVRNVSQVNLALYRMPPADFLRANGKDWHYWENYRGDKNNLIRQWSLDTEPPLNWSYTYGTNLAGDETSGMGQEGQASSLPPGLYYLEAWADADAVYTQALPAGPGIVNREMLVVSRHNLTLKTTATDALVWATNLPSGNEAPDLSIQVMDEDGNVLSRGTTGQDGVFLGSGRWPTSRQTPVFAFVGDPANPGPDFAAAVNGWDSGLSPYRFDLTIEDYQGDHAAYFYTERPIYRPGQDVYFKGILRRADDAHYSLPAPDAQVNVVIRDPRGIELFNEDFPVNDMGALDGKFILDEEAAVGQYTIKAKYNDKEFSCAFRVAEYRKPEFQVMATTDRPEYAQGDTITLTAQASYFFGGPVANAAVQYAVLSANHFFNYQGQGRWDFGDYDVNHQYTGRSSYGYGTRIAEGTGTTDAQGRFIIGLSADIAKSVASQLFTLEVSVTDASNQQVSNRTEAIVHKGLRYIGLRPDRYVGKAGQESRVNIISVGWASQPLPNQEMQVVFLEHTWYSVRKQAEDGRYYWQNEVKDVPVYTATVNTAGDHAVASFTPLNGGLYKVVASGLDEKNNAIRSTTKIWISGPNYINWGQQNNNTIELVADKKQYRVGDTAIVLIPHPYQSPVKALITVERGHIYRNWVQVLETNSEQIQIPITEDLVPNIFVSVVIVKGQDESTPLPDFKLGYVQLPIEISEKELSITLEPDKSPGEYYGPGERVTYSVNVVDSKGRPVVAELALSLVDLSVLSLADPSGADLVSYFWRERGLGVRTASGLTISGDRVNVAIAPEAKGGDGGGPIESGDARRSFVDTAFWNPVVRTDENGHATVSVILPDNLTTWRLSAWGVTAETQAGRASVDIVSTQDVLIRPVAPRFLVPGDQAELAALVHNNTGQPLKVQVILEVDGLQIGEPANRQINIPAYDNIKVTWPVTAENTSEIKLRFGVRADSEKASDAVEISLPVHRHSTPETVATAGQLDADGQRLEAVVLPPSFDPTQGELAVQLNPSLAAGMIDGLKFLEHYPYECTEQTVSRFLPNVVTFRAFKELGFDRPDLEQALPDLVATSLQRLYNQQHYDGGWGWWVLDKSDPFLTAYVLLGMIEAERASLTVDKKVMEHAAGYLQNNLDKPQDLELHWQANRQAFILYVLAVAGQGDLGRTVTLFDQRDVLDTFGKAYLAMALKLLEPDKRERIDALLSDITSAAIVSATGAHWEEAQADYYAMNTDTRSTAIVLAALARLNPDHALGANTVRWLMAARQGGYWETTQETAWAIIGLTDWMVATQELEGAYTWQVTLNDTSLGLGNITRQNISQTVKLQVAVAELAAGQVNRVAVERSAPLGQWAGSGRLYYSMALRYFKPVEQVTALNRGIIVSRQYTLAGCGQDQPCRAIDQAQIGDVIQVKLTLIAPNDLHYVIVEDPFPAGAEGVDQSLKTTSIVGQPPTLTRTDQRNPWSNKYGWWWFSHAELRDEKAVLFATYLPRGTYEYTYLIRASLPGKYRAAPTIAYEMYFPEVFGRSDGGILTITDIALIGH